MRLGFFGRLAALAVAALALASGGRALAAPYLLQPGDVVRVTVGGLSELAGAAPVDNDGRLRLPLFAEVEAAGAPLAEVEARLRDVSLGRIVRRIDGAGGAVIVPVSVQDIHLSIEALRPIHVLGAVRTPGSVPFRPGMTIRAAIAASGGMGSVAAIATGSAAAEAAPRLVAEFRTLAMTRARLRAQLWRVGAALGDAGDAPDPATLGVDAATGARLIEEQRRLLAIEGGLTESERAFLSAALRQNEERARILAAQETQHNLAVEADEEELGRVRQLLSRGVVANDRLLDIRRAQVLSATRLLSTQGEIERVKLEQIRLAQQIEIMPAAREQRLTSEMADLRARLEETEIRLGAVRESLEINGLGALAEAAAGPAQVVATIHRGLGAAATALVAGLDDLVDPGDVVEIALVAEAVP